MFIPATNLHPIELSSPSNGFFIGRRGTFTPDRMLITSDGQGSYGVDLNSSDRPFTYMELGPNWSGVRGVLVPEPRVEVDVDSIFDPARQDEQPGDLVLTGAGPAIVVYPSNGAWERSVRLPLWGVGPATSNQASAFRSWRLIPQNAESDQMLWERVQPEPA